MDGFDIVHTVVVGLHAVIKHACLARDGSCMDGFPHRSHVEVEHEAPA